MRFDDLRQTLITVLYASPVCGLSDAVGHENNQVFRFNRLVFRANDPVGPTGLPAKIMDARFKRYPPKMAYLLHWGIERTRDRYALPGSPRYRRASADQIAVPESYAD